MYGHAQSVWRHANLGDDFDLRHRSLVAPDKSLERIKLFRPAAGGELVPQAGVHLVQQRERPAFFKGLVGRRGEFGGFGQKVSLGFARLIQREERTAAAPFLRLREGPFVREKILERDKQEGAQPAAIRVCQFDLFSLQKTGEGSLGEINRVIRAVALAADKDVNRTPISAAELLEGFECPGRDRVGGSQHDAPVRGRKPGLGPLSFEEILIGRCHAAAEWSGAKLLCSISSERQVNSTDTSAVFVCEDNLAHLYDLMAKGFGGTQPAAQQAWRGDLTLGKTLTAAPRWPKQGDEN